jgi:salicylate hydroxylase
LKNQHVVVAGGGIGGLAAALALARAGQRVTVLERAAQFADVGAGIQLGPNAIKVLASWGLRSAVLAQACLPEAIVVRSATTGRSISRILLGGAVQQRYGEVYASVHRADLHAALLEAVQHEADVQLHCGEELRSATQPTATEGDSVQVQTSQRSLQANALVAADGVWSSVRQAVLADGAPHATGHAAYRVLLPMAQVPAALRTQHVGVWWAPKVHVVHYPVRGGEFLNLVVLSEQPAARAVPGWASPISHAAVVQGMQQTCWTACRPISTHGKAGIYMTAPQHAPGCKATWPCWATLRTLCCPTWRKVLPWPWKTPQPWPAMPPFIATGPPPCSTTS